MPERLDAVAARDYTTRDGEAKTAFTRIGTAWATRNGGWRVVLEALPVARLTDKGQVETSFLLMPPKSSGSGGGAPAADDDVPFRPW